MALLAPEGQVASLQRQTPPAQPSQHLPSLDLLLLVPCSPPRTLKAQLSQLLRLVPGIEFHSNVTFANHGISLQAQAKAVARLRLVLRPAQHPQPWLLISQVPPSEVWLVSWPYFSYKLQC